MSEQSAATESVNVIGLPAIEGLRLFETSRLAHSIPRQYYDTYVITLVSAGYGRIFYRGAFRTFAAGSAFRDNIACTDWSSTLHRLRSSTQ
jgi:hypothetical protein